MQPSFNDSYSEKKAITQGRFCSVLRVVHRETQTPMIAKIFDKRFMSQEQLAAAHHEVSILEKINHPHCLQFVESIEEERFLYVLLGSASGGDALSRMLFGFPSERQVAVVVEQLCFAVKYLHSIGIVHRDIKPANILFDHIGWASMRLGDFGLAGFLNDEEDMKMRCGTPGFAAPEIVSGSAYDARVDLWSIGVTIAALLIGKNPFDLKGQLTDAEIFAESQKGQIDFSDECFAPFTEDAIEVIKSLVQVEPSKRTSLDDLLLHPWFMTASLQTTKTSASE